LDGLMQQSKESLVLIMKNAPCTSHGWSSLTAEILFVELQA